MKEFRALTRVTFAVVLAAMFVELSNPAVAAPPDTLSYQAVARDSGGTPLDGTFDFTFRLYTDTAGGTAIWTETHSNVTVVAGALSVELGSATSFFTSGSEVPFDRPLFLSVEVNTDGEAAPRLLLSSAPFAFASGSPLSEINVDCGGGESLQAALDSAISGHGRLIVNVDGFCAENVVVTRDNVTLRGVNRDNGGAVVDPPVHGITGQLSSEPAVKVLGARGVIVDNLVLNGVPASSGDYGAHVLANGDLKLRDVRVVDTATGLFANRGGFLIVENSTVQDQSAYALLVTDAGHAWVSDTTLVANSSSGSTIGVFRSANVRMQGDNSITNQATGGIAVWAVHGAQVRQDNGLTSVSGQSEAAKQSQIQYREANVSGDLRSFDNSAVEVQSASGVELVNGEIVVAGSALVKLNSGATGTVSRVQVDGGGELSVGNGAALTVTGDVGTSGGSRIGLAQSGSLTVQGSLFLNGSRLIVGGGSSISVTGDAFINVGSEVSVIGPDASFSSADLKVTNGSRFHMAEYASGNAPTLTAGAMSVLGKSLFLLERRATVTLSQVLTLRSSDLDSGEDVTLDAAGLDIAEHSGLRILGPNTTFTLTANPGAGLAGSGSIGRFVDVRLEGGGTLSADGDLSFDSYAHLDMRDSQTITAARFIVGQFSLISSGAGVTFNGEMDLSGGSRLNATGDNITQNGNLLIGGPGRLFLGGTGYTVNGNVDCNNTPFEQLKEGGGTVTFGGGGTFVNCPAP